MSRKYEYDILRVIACISVVSIHTMGHAFDISIYSGDWKIINLYELLVRYSVCIFFMISGALFLNREEIDLKSFLLKNVGHLLVFYFIWSGIYFFHTLYRTEYSGIDAVISEIIAGAGGYQLWFIPCLIMVYLLFPILHSAIHRRHVNIKYIIALFVFFGILYETIRQMPVYPAWIDVFMNKFAPEYFTYSGYAVLGYWLSNIKIGRERRYWLIVIFVINSLVGAFGNYQISCFYEEPMQQLYKYLTIPQCINAVCIFAFFVSRDSICLPERMQRIVRGMSGCTLGVYAIHILVLYYVINYVCSVPTEYVIINVPVFCLAINFISFFVIAIIRRIPFIRKIAM